MGVTATVLVTDNDSMVVLGDLLELYVLSKAKVEQNYEKTVHEIHGSQPLDVLFKSQGFKEYTRKRKPKFFYQIQAEDNVPPPFHTTFGGVQSAKVGDHLVMPDVSDCEGHMTPEIYMLPQESIISFTAIKKDPKKHLFRSGLAMGHKSPGTS